MKLLKNKKKLTKTNNNNPLKLLTLNLEDHDYSHCKNEFCAECNHMADEIIEKFKISNNQKGRIRLTKFQVQRMKDFFGEIITKKAINRFNRSDVYKRRHYNIIPCSCRTKSHHDCEGYYGEKLDNTLKSTIHRNCKCKRHSRPELKRFKEHNGQIYL